MQTPLESHRNFLSFVPIIATSSITSGGIDICKRIIFCLASFKKSDDVAIDEETKEEKKKEVTPKLTRKLTQNELFHPKTVTT